MGSFVLLSILIGALFILLSLIIVLLKPDLGQQAFWIIRVMVALGAGLVAAGILGNLTIEGTVANLTIKAGGPIAVTVMVYLLNPPKLVHAIGKKGAT